MIYTFVATCAPLPSACCMQWFNIKKVVEQRQKSREETTSPERGASNGIHIMEKTLEIVENKYDRTCKVPLVSMMLVYK